jgi:3D (Asp-Asp-Asp) domain-containing protein
VIARPRLLPALGARAVLGASALIAAVRPQRQVGEALAQPPAAVTGELRADPVVVRAAPPADSAASARPTVMGSLLRRARTGEQVVVKLTAYCLKGLTRTDTRARAGVAAGDPRVFPLRRYVEVYIGKRRLGRFRVEDTGAAVRGTHLDIWTASCADARRFGRRRGIAVLTARHAGQQIEITEAGGKALGLASRE